MKTNNILILWAIALIFLSSCEKEDVILNETIREITTQTPLTDECSEEFTLFAGQHIDVGSIIVTNDDTTIYVTYTTENGWVLNETHLYVGSPDAIPTNNAGNPQIGLFPYNNSHNGITSYTIEIPIDESLECYAIAAHASVSLIQNNEVIQSETAWSNGNQINNGGSWAMYSNFCLLDCCDEDPTIYNYFAGQNIDVGILEVSNDNENLYITYRFNNGWLAKETHLFVGSLEDLPSNNAGIPVPGQFPYSNTHDPYTSTFTYTIPLSEINLECFIIAAHSSLVLLDEDGSIIQTETGWSFGEEFPDSPRWGWYSEFCQSHCE